MCHEAHEEERGEPVYEVQRQSLEEMNERESIPPVANNRWP
jgi:hypothetical protein